MCQTLWRLWLKNGRKPPPYFVTSANEKTGREQLLAYIGNLNKGLKNYDCNNIPHLGYYLVWYLWLFCTTPYKVFIMRRILPKEILLSFCS